MITEWLAAVHCRSIHMSASQHGKLLSMTCGFQGHLCTESRSWPPTSPSTSSCVTYLGAQPSLPPSPPSPPISLFLSPPPPPPPFSLFLSLCNLPLGTSC